jgi:signal transduction histidine kinase
MNKQIESSAKHHHIVNRLMPPPAKPSTPKPQEQETAVPPWFRPLAVALFLLVLGSIVGYVFLNLSICWTHSSFDIYQLSKLVGPLGGLGFAGVGLIILYKYPANRIGWLCSSGGLWLALYPVLDMYMSCALDGRISPLVLPLTAWFAYTILPLLTILSIFIFLPLWFPNGRFLTWRWRWFGLTMLILMSILTLAVAITPTFRQNNSVGMSYPLDNPLGLAWLPSWWGTFFASAMNLLMIFGSLGAVSSIILRFKRAVGDERQQMRLFTYWTTAVIIQLIAFELIIYRLAPLIEDTIWYDWLWVAYSLNLIVVFLGFPLIVGMSIFKYRLYDIDIIINRTLVYGGLSLGIVAVYVLIVGALGALFQAQDNYLFALLATGLIAALFQPVRERLQRGVNRLMFGERDDPTAVFSQLAQQLETADSPADILPNLVHTIAHTLKIPYVAIWLPHDNGNFEPVAYWGNAPEQVEMMPEMIALTYQHETIGQLVVAPRSPNESFDRREKQLLASIAALTANTVRAVTLSDELRQSRRRIVTAREEERRRLRRDLHDGLGPQLASQTLGLEAIARLIDQNPEKAKSLLASIQKQSQTAVADIRHLIYDLRPPTLDDLGLVGALKQTVANYEGETTRFVLDVAEPLPLLPAAVETAAFRITQEAITNVVRHARATTCTIHLCLQANQLTIEIRDDGRGIGGDDLSGVGLQSMQERAAELNGRLTISSSLEGGTHVVVWLPLEEIGE